MSRLKPFARILGATAISVALSFTLFGARAEESNRGEYRAFFDLDYPRPLTIYDDRWSIPTLDLLDADNGAWLVVTNVTEWGKAASVKIMVAADGETDHQIRFTLQPFQSYAAPVSQIARELAWDRLNQATLYIIADQNFTYELLRIESNGALTGLSQLQCGSDISRYNMFQHVFGQADAAIAQSSFVLTNEGKETEPFAFIFFDSATGKRVADWNAALFPQSSVRIPAALIERSAPLEEQGKRYNVVFQRDNNGRQPRLTIQHMVMRPGVRGKSDLSGTACSSQYVNTHASRGVASYTIASPPRPFDPAVQLAVEAQGFEFAWVRTRASDGSYIVDAVDNSMNEYVLRVDQETYEILESRKL